MYKKITIVSVIAVAVMVIAGVVLVKTNKNAAINASAKKTYVFRRYLKNDPIKITLNSDGVAIIRGTVSEWSHRLLAGETVAGLPGVKHVENRLKATSGQPPEGSDLWTGMKVKTIVMLHWNVNGIQIDVDVNDGVVTLQGIVTSEAQKELMTKIVKNVEGVKDVVNRMNVIEKRQSVVDKTVETIDDLSITTQIKIALLFHRSTRLIKVNITTNNGIVTISGVASNNAEKELAGKLVNDIRGVKGLKNEITVG